MKKNRRLRDGDVIAAVTQLMKMNHLKESAQIAAKKENTDYRMNQKYIFGVAIVTE